METKCLRANDVKIRRKRTSSLPCHESIVQRSAQKQRTWKIVHTLLCRFGNDQNCFSHKYFCKSAQSLQSSREEYETFHDRTGKPVVGGQSSCSFVPSVIKTHIPLTDDPAQPEDLLQRYKERIEKLSQQDRVSKFCTDAGFLTTVEVGQYFMTKDTEEFSQFTDSVTCREYTLPRDEKVYLNQKVGFEGTPKIGPCWKLQPVACTVSTELRSGFCLWTNTILTPGSELLMDQTNLWWIWTTTTQKFLKISSKNMRYNWMRRILQADQRPKQNHREENLPALPQEPYLLGKELGPMLNHNIIHSPIIQYRRNWSIFFVMVVYLEKTMERLNSGD